MRPNYFVHGFQPWLHSFAATAAGQPGDRRAAAGALTHACLSQPSACCDTLPEILDMNLSCSALVIATLLIPIAWTSCLCRPRDSFTAYEDVKQVLANLADALPPELKSADAKGVVRMGQGP
jgi:hypothetical protein